MLAKKRKKKVGKKTQKRKKNSPEELEVGGRRPVDAPLAVVDADPFEVVVCVGGVGGTVVFVCVCACGGEERKVFK